MLTLETKPVDTARAKEIWAEYQKKHDISSLRGQFAAIEPKSGRVWIAPDALDLIDLKEKDGNTEPVYMICVGYDYFVRKGRR